MEDTTATTTTQTTQTVFHIPWNSESKRVLVPAYCVTLHKMQGDETPFLYCMLESGINVRWVYTAMTRPRRRVICYVREPRTYRGSNNNNARQSYLYGAPKDQQEEIVIGGERAAAAASVLSVAAPRTNAAAQRQFIQAMMKPSIPRRTALACVMQQASRKAQR
jgi:hypothetical protein